MHENFGKKAFTLIEIIFVIVVLGIVAAIGSRVIANSYEGYFRSFLINKLELKTELAIEQIASRLQNRIRSSIISRENNTSFLPLSTDEDTSNNQIIEWIGSNYEGFLGDNNGAFWNAFIDLNSSDTNKTALTLSTPGSRLNSLDTLVSNLSDGDVNTTAFDMGLIFRGTFKDYQDGFGYDHSDFNHSDIFPVRVNDDEILEINTDTAIITERYDLAWSAYALVPQGNDSNDFNLTLFYNYRPWLNESYFDGDSSVLVDHVSTFRVYQSGEFIRLKLCINDEDQSRLGENVGFCKEKVIF